jgi:hypothetical protein
MDSNPIRRELLSDAKAARAYVRTLQCGCFGKKICNRCQADHILKKMRTTLENWRKNDDTPIRSS